MASFYSSVVLLCLTDFFLDIKAENKYAAFKFTRHPNSKINCGVFYSSVANPMDCQNLCADTLRCFSANTYKNSKGEEICQLSRESFKTSKQTDGCLVSQQGATNHELTEIDSCSEDHCKIHEDTRAALSSGWYRLGQYKYKLFSKLQSWDKAQQTCSGHGGNLATIDREFELKFIGDVFARPVPDLTDSMSPKYYWKLDGKDTNVTLYGGANLKNIDWITQTVLYLPGTTGSYTTTPVIDVLDKSFSISVWVQPIKTGSFMPIFGYWDRPLIFMILIRDNNIILDLRRKSDFWRIMAFTSQGNVPLYRWTHIACSWDRPSGNLKVYKNGQLVDSNIASPPEDLPNPILQNFDIGLKRDSGGVFTGYVSRLAVFDRVLTEEQIKTISYMKMIWLGKMHGHTKFAGSLDTPNSPCVSFHAYSPRDTMDKVDCTTKMQFVCKKPV